MLIFGPTTDKVSLHQDNLDVKCRLKGLRCSNLWRPPIQTDRRRALKSVRLVVLSRNHNSEQNFRVIISSAILIRSVPQCLDNNNRRILTGNWLCVPIRRSRRSSDIKPSSGDGGSIYCRSSRCWHRIIGFLKFCEHRDRSRIEAASV